MSAAEMPPGDPAPPLRIESRSISIRHRGAARAFGWSAAALAGLWFVLLETRTAVGARLSGWSFVLAALFWLGARLWADRRAGAIVVHPDKLVVERGATTREIPLAAIVEGWINPRVDDVTLRLRGGDVVTIRVGSVEHSKELLAAARVDASRRTMRLQLGETAFWDILTVLLGPILILPLSVAIADGFPRRLGDLALNVQAAVGVVTFGVLFTLLFWLVRELLGPARLTVGADGIVVRQLFGRRFVPFARLTRGGASVQVAPEHVVLSTLDGEVRARTRHLSDDERPQLTARIAHAIEVWQAGDGRSAALCQLDRGGRSFAAWQDALTALVGKAEGYRQTVLSREQVEGALLDASVSAERRIGAALALTAGDASARTRVRVASEACANPRLRVALEEIARGAPDEATLEAAMEEAAREATPREAQG